MSLAMDAAEVPVPKKRKNAFCPRGHLVAGANARVLKSGYVTCRECVAEHSRKFYRNKVKRPVRQYIKEDSL
jgi:hypothetical protein